MAENLPDTATDSLPVPYVTPYTDRTPVIGPLFLTAVKRWAVTMLEWGSLRFIDHAPTVVWIASFFIAALVLVIFERKEWLDFKNRKYLRISLAILLLTWIGISAYGYFGFNERPINPAVAKLQQQLATALRDRDAAIVERDNARREHDVTAIPPPSRLQPAKNLMILMLE
jgi:hypothetical protein